MSDLRVDYPVPGYYRMKLVKGGVWVPVKIYRPCLCTIGGPMGHEWQEECDRFPQLSALVDGWELASPREIWMRCRPIPEEDYNILTDRHAVAREEDPESPKANPREPINLDALPPLF